jgi:hypothetical protein
MTLVLTAPTVCVYCWSKGFQFSTLELDLHVTGEIQDLKNALDIIRIWAIIETSWNVVLENIRLVKLDS